MQAQRVRGNIAPTHSWYRKYIGWVVSITSEPGIEPRSPGRPARSQTLYWLNYPAHNHHKKTLKFQRGILVSNEIIVLCVQLTHNSLVTIFIYLLQFISLLNLLYIFHLRNALKTRSSSDPTRPAAMPHFRNRVHVPWLWSFSRRDL
jgi:hypothetical protein